MNGRSQEHSKDRRDPEPWNTWRTKEGQVSRQGLGSAWHEAAATCLRAASVRCPLCRGELPLDGASDAVAWLSCGHAFCHVCLRAYVDESYSMSWSLPCPACGAESAPPWGVWHLCLNPSAGYQAGQATDFSGRTAAADPRPFNYGMCAECAATGWFSAAGRRCVTCDTVLCDTCGYAHVVSSGQGGTQEHQLVSLHSDVDTGQLHAKALHTEVPEEKKADGRPRETVLLDGVCSRHAGENRQLYRGGSTEAALSAVTTQQRCQPVPRYSSDAPIASSTSSGCLGAGDDCTATKLAAAFHAATSLQGYFMTI